MKKITITLKSQSIKKTITLRYSKLFSEKQNSSELLVKNCNNSKILE